MSGATTQTVSVGARFAQALAARDFEQIADLLDPEIEFGAITPKNRIWQARGPEQVIGDVLREWFDDDLELERVTNLHVEELPNCERLCYRLLGSDAEGPFLVDHQAFVEHADGQSAGCA